jgi:hypothetical protein
MLEVQPKALIIGTETALNSNASGASIRFKNISDLVQKLGFDAKMVTKRDAKSLVRSNKWDLIVLVSFSNLKLLRISHKNASLVWLDCTDSILLTRKSLMFAGDLRQPIALLLDRLRLLYNKPPGVISYITELDRDLDSTLRLSKTNCYVFPLNPEKIQVRDDVNSSRLVFVGDGRYLPNRKAIEFLEEVLLFLDESQKIDIYGSGYQKNAHPQLKFHGYKDDQDVYRIHDIHLAPMNYGAGMKAKVAIPLLSGLRVISTTTGANGFKASANLQIADSPPDFARVIKSLQSNWELSKPTHDQLFSRDQTEELLHFIQSYL